MRKRARESGEERWARNKARISKEEDLAQSGRKWTRPRSIWKWWTCECKWPGHHWAVEWLKAHERVNHKIGRIESNRVGAMNNGNQTLASSAAKSGHVKEKSWMRMNERGKRKKRMQKCKRLMKRHWKKAGSDRKERKGHKATSENGSEIRRVT